MSDGQSSKGFFEQLSPKSALLVGLIGGVMALCTIGFVVFLVLFLRGDLAKKVADAQQVVPAPSQQQQQQQPTQPTGPVNVGVGQFPALGKSSAPVTVIEFADLRCPFCEQFFTQVEPQIIKDYVNTGKVKFYFRDFAFLGPASTLAGQAAYCAQQQGKFWQFHDWMYQNQADESNTDFYTADKLETYAANLGMNKTTFTSCLNSSAAQASVQQDLTDGQTAGVNGTPTVFVNGTAIVGAQPYANFKTAIDQALAAAK